MTIVNFKFSNKILDPVSTYNDTGTYNPINIGVVIANALDATGAASGLSLSVTVACDGTSGSSLIADADAWGVPQKVWQSSWLFASATKDGEVKISGFAAGQSGTITTAGHGNNTRQTSYIVNGGAPVTYVGKVKPPAQPVTIPFTANGSGEVFISTNFNNSFSYVNFISLDYTINTTPTITSITNLVAGETATMTLSSSSYGATTATLSDGVISKVVALTHIGAGSFTFTTPQWIESSTAIKYGTIDVTATDGSTTTNALAVVISPQEEYEWRSLASLSAQNYGQDVGFSPSLKIGSQVVYDASKITVYADGTLDTLIFDGTYWVDSGFEGVTQVWDRDPDDKIARVANLTIGGGGVVITGTSNNHYIGLGLGIGFH